MRDFEYEIVREIVVAHHEYKQDPYPRSGRDRREIHRASERRKGENKVSKFAQIVAVSDMFDALASSRAYKKGLSKEGIEAILYQQFKGDEKYIVQVLGRYDYFD